MSDKFPEKYKMIGNSSLILEKESPHQIIRLYKHSYKSQRDGRDKKGYWLSLNGEAQFHTSDNISHKYMVVIPLLLAKNLNNILVIGGGDGLPAKELLNFPVSFTNIELDDTLVNLVKEHPVLKRISNNSLNNHRNNLIVGDGIDHLVNSTKKYDLIIDDCEVDYTNQPKEQHKYKKYMYCLLEKLNSGGIVSHMEPVPKEFRQKIFNNTAKGRKKIFSQIKADQLKDWVKIAPFIQSKILFVPFLGYEHHMYFSNEPMRLRRKIKERRVG